MILSLRIMDRSKLKNRREHLKPLQMLNDDSVVKICAPMVRYSKLAFRALVKKYDCDLMFTPMIMSDSFVKSQKARDSEFSTNADDFPLIVQFAAKKAEDFADASEMVYPFADGVDLNCGCPQRWALKEGIGACLIKKPELMADILLQTRNRISDPDFTVSTKIRIHDDIRRTVDLCQRVERTGVSWVTVHGRTAEQRSQPVNLEAIRIIKDSLQIPVIANGDIRSLDDVHRVGADTGVDGVMSARGLLSNPALYSGYNHTPIQCVKDWVDLSLSLGTPFQIFHHHLIYMLENITSKAEKRVFNSLHSTAGVLDYLKQHYDV